LAFIHYHVVGNYCQYNIVDSSLNGMMLLVEFHREQS